MSINTARAACEGAAPSEASEAARREGSRKNALWISARVAGGRRPPRSRACRRTRRQPERGERGRARGRDGSARGAHTNIRRCARGGRRRAREDAHLVAALSELDGHDGAGHRVRPGARVADAVVAPERLNPTQPAELHETMKRRCEFLRIALQPLFLARAAGRILVSGDSGRTLPPAPACHPRADGAVRSRVEHGVVRQVRRPRAGCRRGRFRGVRGVRWERQDVRSSVVLRETRPPRRRPPRRGGVRERRRAHQGAGPRRQRG